MRLHRFFIDNDLASHFAGGIFSIQDAAINHQLAKVLRAKAGDPIQLFDRGGIEITGTIETIKKGMTEVRIDQTESSTDESDKKTTLYLAMLKRENFELTVQKATEIGITTIVPLLTERTVKTGFNRARIEKIAIEAAEQSGRTSVPEIADPMSFISAIAQKYDKKIFLDFDGEKFDPAVISNIKNIALFVGPEGGWTPAEREAAEAADCTITTISQHTLRAETAAIIGSYLIVGN